MDISELKQIVAEIEPRKGWNFSDMNVWRVPVPWSYHEVVRQYLTNNSRVLDIGTGGAERITDLASAFGQGVGIDTDSDMLQTARENLSLCAQANVALAQMDGGRLGLSADSVNVVLNRQAPIDAAEVVHVLKPGGVVITQQVGERNTENVCAAFDCGPSGHYDTSQAQDFASIVSAFHRQGCAILAQAEYDVPYWFRDVESFIFWLQAIPMPEDFHIETHGPIVQRIIDSHWTTNGIRTNEHRRLLVARRPKSRFNKGQARSAPRGTSEYNRRR